MSSAPGGTITVGTRLCFDGGLWEVTELTATAVVLRDSRSPERARATITERNSERHHR